MRLALSKPTHSDEDTRLLFSRFHEVGYDGLQLKMPQYIPYLDDPDRFLGELAEHPGSASALIVNGTTDQVREVLPFGRAVGAERIVFCHCLSRDGLAADDIRGIARSVADLGKEVGGYGMRLSLHHHYGHPVMHRQDFDVFFDEVPGDAIGLTVDTAHLVKSGISDMAGLIRDFGHVVDNFHLKDFADGEFKVLGTGSIDFEPVFAAIAEIGYAGWISADEESGAGTVEAMVQCCDFMRAGIRES